jgi:flagellar biosynthetic protein FliP
MKKSMLLAAALGAALIFIGPAIAGADAFSLNVKGGASGIQVMLNSPANGQDLSGLLKIFLLLTLVSIAPALILMCTSFTRIIIVLSFLRQALGVNQIPPNQVLIAIALFLTLFNMMPVWQEIQTKAVQPYEAGQISWQQTLDRGAEPLRVFMLRHTRPKDLNLFVKLSRQPLPNRPQDVSLMTLIPAFLISELKVAFQIGFLLYIPFLVVDMVVASILLSMGMMMLPPIMVSLPFKILLFVLVDGWNLLIVSLMRSI